MTAPTYVLHQPEQHRFLQSLPRLDVRVVFALASFLPC